MKKLLLCLVALLGIMNAAAEQRSYVTIYNDGNNENYGRYVTMYLNGDVPAGVKRAYYSWNERLGLGEVMNILAAKGFTLDQINGDYVVMSRPAADPSPYPLQKFDVNDDQEVNVGDVNKEVDVVLDPAKYRGQ